MGLVTALGLGKQTNLRAFLVGEHRFGVLTRPGRQHGEQYLGAEIPSLAADLPVAGRRHMGVAGEAAVAATEEAWAEAGLADQDPRRIGLVVGGSNLQQREMLCVRDRHADRPQYLSPTYAMRYLDSDICGLCSSHFSIQGGAWTVGGASASGQLAIIEATRMVQSGEVDACIALGALADLSHWELRALKSIGAMGSERFAELPGEACRPFDEARDGFIFGEACAAVVVESAQSARARGVYRWAEVAGWAVTTDGHRGPEPSAEGEAWTIGSALARAGVTAAQVEYVNPHGSGSVLGDATEVDALRRSGLTHAWLNATKSIVGHGLSAAGAVELAITLLQMREGMLHPTRNLERPIDGSLNWVYQRAVTAEVSHALCLSIGFGGINTAVCVRRCDD